MSSKITSVAIVILIDYIYGQVNVTHFILDTMTTIGVAALTYYYILLYGNKYYDTVLQE